MPPGTARTSLLLLAGLLSAVWLAIGASNAYTYLHRYDLYRGFARPETPAGVPRGSMHEVMFRSGSTGHVERYFVYLPPRYRRMAAHGRRFPVLYLLHGSPGKATVFHDVDAADVRANVLIAQHRIRPLIMVMPAGRQGPLSSDTEWANTSAGRWMSFLVDVVHDVDHRFATQADRQHRGLAGDSEGGYAAINVALHHLRMFSVAESWSGYFTQTPTSVFAGASAAALRANSPVAEVARLAARIHRVGLRAWLYQGKTDHANPQLLEHFAAQLHAAGAQVGYGFFPGGHDWALWRAQTPRMLVVAGRWFAQRPAHGSSFTQVGRALPYAQVRRILAAQLRRCLALEPGSAQITPKCHRMRQRHGLE